VKSYEIDKVYIPPSGSRARTRRLAAFAAFRGQEKPYETDKADTLPSTLARTHA